MQPTPYYERYLSEVKEFFTRKTGQSGDSFASVFRKAQTTRQKLHLVAEFEATAGSISSSDVRKVGRAMQGILASGEGIDLQEVKAWRLGIQTEGVSPSELEKQIADKILVDFWEAADFKDSRVKSQEKEKRAKEIRECLSDDAFTSNIIKLELEGKKLKYLPPEIGQFKSLKLLNVRDNQITELPQEICQLDRLQILALDHNLLNTVPATIGSLKELRSVSLVNNGLKELPPAIVKLNNLEKLILKDNPIKDLPKELIFLTSLQAIDIKNTKIDLNSDTVKAFQKMWGVVVITDNW